MYTVRDYQIQQLKEFFIEDYRENNKLLTQTDLTYLINMALPEIKKGTSLYSGLTADNMELATLQSKINRKDYINNYLLALKDIDILTAYYAYMSNTVMIANSYQSMIETWSQMNYNKLLAIMAKSMLSSDSVVIGFIEKFITYKYIHDTNFDINTTEGYAYSHKLKKYGVEITSIQALDDSILIKDETQSTIGSFMGKNLHLDFELTSISDKIKLRFYFKFNDVLSVFIKTDSIVYYQIQGTQEKVLAMDGNVNVNGAVGEPIYVDIYPQANRYDSQYLYKNAFNIGIVDLDKSQKYILSKPLAFDYAYNYLKVSFEPHVDNLTFQIYKLTETDLAQPEDVLYTTISNNEMKWININPYEITNLSVLNAADIYINGTNVQTSAEMHTTSLRFYLYDIFNGLSINLNDTSIKFDNIYTAINSFSREVSDYAVNYSTSSLIAKYTIQNDIIHVPVMIDTYMEIDNSNEIIIQSPYIIRDPRIKVFVKTEEIPKYNPNSTILSYEYDPNTNKIILHNFILDVTYIKVQFITYLEDIVNVDNELYYKIVQINKFKIIDNESGKVLYDYFDTSMGDLNINQTLGYVYVMNNNYSTYTMRYEYDIDLISSIKYVTYRLYAHLADDRKLHLPLLDSNAIANGAYITFNDEIQSTKEEFIIPKGDTIIEIFTPENRYNIMDTRFQYELNDLVYGYPASTYIPYSEFVKTIGSNDMSYYSYKYVDSTIQLVLPFHYILDLNRIVPYNLYTNTTIDSINLLVQYSLIDISQGNQYTGLVYRLKYTGYDQLALDAIKIAVV